jgi:hypothetical protein
MKRTSLTIFALAAAGSLTVAGSAAAQSRTMTAREIQQRYGVSTYETTTLHPDGHRSTAVPVEIEDGRTGELVIPSGRTTGRKVYYRDDQTGNFHPVKMNTKVTRKQFVQAPHAVKYQAVPPRSKTRSWEQEALIVGGSAGGGALIGAAAGGAKGAGVGAAAGGVGGLIYDLLTRTKK